MQNLTNVKNQQQLATGLPRCSRRIFEYKDEYFHYYPCESLACHRCTEQRAYRFYNAHLHGAEFIRNEPFAFLIDFPYLFCESGQHHALQKAHRVAREILKQAEDGAYGPIGAILAFFELNALGPKKASPHLHLYLIPDDDLERTQIRQSIKDSISVSGVKVKGGKRWKGGLEKALLYGKKRFFSDKEGKVIEPQLAEWERLVFSRLDNSGRNKVHMLYWGGPWLRWQGNRRLHAQAVREALVAEQPEDSDRILSEPAFVHSFQNSPMARLCLVRRCPECGEAASGEHGLKRNGVYRGRNRWRCKQCEACWIQETWQKRHQKARKRIQDTLILKLFQEGKSVREISAATGVTRASIAELLRAEGYGWDYGKWTHQKGELRRLESQWKEWRGGVVCRNLSRGANDDEKTGLSRRRKPLRSRSRLKEKILAHP